MHNDTRSLPELRAELQALATELTDTIERPLRRGDGQYTMHQDPPLLAKLRDMVATGSERGTVRGRSSIPIPIDPTASDLLRTINTGAIQMHANAVRTTSAIEAHIHALVSLSDYWTDTNRLEHVIDQLRAWADSIRNLLNPPRKLHVAAACPACDVRMVHRPDDTGQTVQVPALTVDVEKGCICLSCGHNWPPANLEHLALVIGCDPIREDLEAAG